MCVCFRACLCVVACSRWCAGAWRLWQPWRVGHGAGSAVCSREQGAIPRHLPWHAGETCSCCGAAESVRAGSVNTNALPRCTARPFVHRHHHHCLLDRCLRPAQVAVIEFARNVLGIKDADSTEFNPGTPNPAVVFMPEISTKHMGGTMRLGARRTVLQSVNCLTAKLYQKEQFIDERHRHRCGMARYRERLSALGGVTCVCCLKAVATVVCLFSVAASCPACFFMSNRLLLELTFDASRCSPSPVPAPQINTLCLDAGMRSTQKWCPRLRSMASCLLAVMRQGSAWRWWSCRTIQLDTPSTWQHRWVDGLVNVCVWVVVVQPHKFMCVCVMERLKTLTHTFYIWPSKIAAPTSPAITHGMSLLLLLLLPCCVVLCLQFHPEFKSRPGRSSPLFLGFILASGRRLNSYLTSRATPQPSPMSTPVKPSEHAAAQLGLDKLTLSPAAVAAANGAPSAAVNKESGGGAQAALFMAG